MKEPDLEKKKRRMRFAIQKAHNDEARSLIHELGIECNVEGSGTPLVMACVYGNDEITKFCLSEDANVNSADSEGDTPLILACANGRDEIVKELLAKGANVNCKNKYEMTPIMNAISDAPEKIEVIKMLLEHGADPFVFIEQGKNHPGRIANNAYELAKYFHRTSILELIDNYYSERGGR